ncbi:hypothetical protein HanRHA438_Chr16g0757851 [Helianthus annuus]|nr:hypothetical protein HanOQP8_Chr16g0614741 [Helianthus annuus]KAJ0821041.1 hypothetical protein HanPSC8_Chr16g0715311 [Helianthus annuus]KAJ0835654.1 hypothetical protein HanRHA438_Chr16g0757851 [Helianthus annuus]
MATHSRKFHDSPLPSSGYTYRSRMSVSPRDRKQNGRSYYKKTCMCSPTTHPGSFRCNLHKNQNYSRSITSQRLNARRSAMTNSLLRICAVEGGDRVAFIRPSSHHQRRRSPFEPRPSRLSLMSTADAL